MLRAFGLIAVLVSVIALAGCSFFNPPDLNVLVDQSRGSISITGLQISPSAMTTNASQEITISCSIQSDFPIQSVTVDLSSVGQGSLKMNPSADKKNWSVKFIAAPTNLGSYAFGLNAVNQKDKSVQGSVTLQVTSLPSGAIYVSPSGDDDNPGNSDSPFRTLTHALDYAAAGGISNIFLAGGSYVESNTAYSSAVALVGLTNLLIQGGWNGAFSARSIPSYKSIISANLEMPTVLTIKNSSNIIVDGLFLRDSRVDPALTNFFTFRGGGVYSESADFQLINCEVSGNETIYGGGMYCVNVSGLVSNCSVVSNTSIRMYGGLLLDRSSLRILRTIIAYNFGAGVSIVNSTNFAFQFNHVLSNSFEYGYSGIGVMISNSSSTFPFYSNRIEKNTDIGLKFVRSDMPSIISNEIVENNGGLYFLSNMSSPLLNNLVANNSYYGMDFQYSSFFIGNNLILSNGSSYGVRLASCYGMTVSNNEIGWNQAYSSVSPVALFNSSNINLWQNNIHNCSIDGYVDNFVASGGIMVSCSTNISIVGNAVLSNTYSSHYSYGAGGIGTSNSVVWISNNVIRWNTGYNGGGILIYYTDFVVFGNTINDNRSSCFSTGLGGGGGIFVYSCGSGNRVIQNNSIQSNILYPYYAYHSGNGIHIRTFVNILSNTIVGNTATGYVSNDAAVYDGSSGGNPNILTNVIGATNTESYGIYTVNSSVGRLEANIFGTNIMNFLFRRPTRTVTNDVSWTNINVTNYTGAAPLTTSNTVKNL